MLEAVEGVYRHGQIDLKEHPRTMREARVIVTFLPEAAPPSEGRMLEYGKYAGVVVNDEDFRAAEWQGEEEFGTP